MSDGRREERAPFLPAGYRVDETDPELVILRREDGSEAAAFDANGTDLAEVKRRAWEDFGGQDERCFPQTFGGIMFAVIALAAFAVGAALWYWDRVGWTIGLLFAVPLIVFLILWGYRHEWTGFGGGQERSKTLWDWMGLLVVPVVLAIVGLVFTAQQNERQQSIEDQRVEQQQKLESQRARHAARVEEQRAQDIALQAYLDQMSQLLLEYDLCNSEEDSEVRTLARAQTLTVLVRLDSSRKVEVMQFLLEANLVRGELVAGEPGFERRSPPIIGLTAGFMSIDPLTRSRSGRTTPPRPA